MWIWSLWHRHLVWPRRSPSLSPEPGHVVRAQLGWWMNANGQPYSEMNLVVDGVNLVTFINPDTYAQWVYFTTTFVGASNNPQVYLVLSVRDDPSYIFLTGFSIQPACILP